jgi:hypothetical protein
MNEENIVEIAATLPSGEPLPPGVTVTLKPPPGAEILPSGGWIVTGDDGATYHVEPT